MHIDNNSRSLLYDQSSPEVGGAKLLKGEYGPEIDKYAKQYGLDPAMVDAIIQKESNGAPNPITTAAAADTTPLKSGSAAELDGRAYSVDELQRNVSLHVEMVCRYLAKSEQEKAGYL